MTWCLKSLSRITTCAVCSTQLIKGDQAWCDVDSSPRLARCLSCGTPQLGFSPDVGWYLLSVLLASELSPDITVLPQYSVPGTAVSVGHVIISPTGVWLVNAVKLEGLISVSARPTSIKAGDIDHTHLLNPLLTAASEVSQLLPDVPVRPALAFVEATWSDSDAARLLRRGPFVVKKVAVAGPHSLIETISAPGRLTPRVLTKTRHYLVESLAG
jgi:hypothetical protein